MSRSNVAYFSSGWLPVRAPGLDRRLPTWGTGDYEWQGFLALADHPHGAQGPSGRLLNWNNQSPPGFMHGDGTPFGSVHRVELFDQFPEQVDLADDAPRLDADDDGFNDHAGPTIMDALFEPLVAEVMRPVFGDLTGALDDIRDLGSSLASSPSGASFVDKDLRTLLGKEVEGKFNLNYCGNGFIDDCRDSLWQVVEDVSQALALERGDDPSTWLQQGARLGFTPGLIPETFRATNRSTFQQVLESTPQGVGGD